MTVRLSAAMIVRDEEQVLGACLDSLIGQADEIVVIDTGSADRTRDIARSFGALVFSISWPDDFSAARNSAVERATGDWILWIDADERLCVPENVRLGGLLDDRQAVGATVTMRPRHGFTPYRELRLFRKDPRIRFKGIIYETVRDGVEAVCLADRRLIRDTPICIDHLGYEGDLSRKHRRNLALLRRAVEDCPDSGFYWSRLAETLVALDDPDEAMGAAREAIRLARASGHAARAADATKAYQTLAGLMAESGEDPLATIEEGLKGFPDNHALRLARARCLVERGRYIEALAISDDLLASDPEAICPYGAVYDVRIFGEFAHDLRGIALLRLERFDEAAAAFEAAAAAAPHDLSYRAKAAAMRGQAARTIPAA
jgi:hypothetical protein